MVWLHCRCRPETDDGRLTTHIEENPDANRVRTTRYRYACSER
jgi:hypothetical protein